LSHWALFPAVDLGLLIPTVTDLADVGAVWVSALLLLSCSRLMTHGHGLPELQLLAGWGLLVLMLTVWGTLAPPAWPLWWPAAGIALAGVVGLFIPVATPRAEDWVALGRTMAMSLPLWAVMASERPSQPDTFINLLPNSAYIYDHGFLPEIGRPESHSFLPGAPYNLQFWAYFAGALLPRLPAVAMAHVNLLLQLAFGLLLARVVQHRPADTFTLDALAERAPGWGATAVGLLLATAFNPGFVPRVALTDYGEAAISVCVGSAGFLVACAFERLAAGKSVRCTLVLLAATLLALVEIKQESVAFVMAFAVSVPLLGLVDRKVGFRGASVALAPAFVPAVLLYLLWRWHVFTHLNGGELHLRAYEQWNWELLPQILRAAAATVAEKGVYFGFLLAALLLLLWRLRRRQFEFATRLLALTVGVALAYDLFLMIAYVVSFSPRMAADAHSFFRYNTHLSLILVLALTGLGRAVIAEHPRLSRASWRMAGACAVILVVALPIALVGRLRFDLMMPQPLVRDLVQEVARLIAPNEKLALVLPGDGGDVATMMEGVLRYEAPRRPDVDLVVLSALDEGTFSALAAQGVTKALISCTPERLADLPAHNAVLLERSGTEWHRIAAWPYPARDGRRWAPSMSAAALCG
jgi:hypothetical protein